MIMTAGLRKLALTTHITASAGWLGSVAAFLALSIAGLASDESHVVRAAYLSMHMTTWFVIVPFCLASLVTGLVESLGTPWGLFRHYWVITKLVLTVLATVILLLHTRPISFLADVAAQTALSSIDFRQLRLQLVGDASAALFVLLVTTTLSVYKPWGMTPFGLRMQSEASGAWQPAFARRSRPAGRYVLLGIAVFVVLVLMLHLFGGGLGSHWALSDARVSSRVSNLHDRIDGGDRACRARDWSNRVGSHSKPKVEPAGNAPAHLAFTAALAIWNL